MEKEMCTWQILCDDENNYRWEIIEDASSVTLLPSPIPLPSMADLLRDQQVELELATENSRSFSNSLFTTGSGKRVTISPSGLVRAKTLLKEHTFGSGIQKLNAIGETYEKQQQHQQESPRLQPHKVINSYERMKGVSNGTSHTLNNDFTFGASFKQAPIKFHTAGGKSLSISSDALQHARSLLGDPDLGDFFDGQIKTSSSCVRSDFDTPLVCPTTSESNHGTKSFTYPLPSSRQTEISNKFLCQGNGNNLIGKFNAVGVERGYSHKSSDTCGEKQLDVRNQVPDAAVCHSLSNGFSSKIDSRGMSLCRPLVNISNSLNTADTNNRQPASGKRRLGLRAIVSPFKRPRSSKFSDPFEQNAEHFPNDLSQSFTGASPFKRPRYSEISNPFEKNVENFPNDLSLLFSGAYVRQRRVCTRYPFRYPRMYIKEFFAVPPLQQKLHFPNLVRQVTPGNAEMYMFQDAYGDNGMGAEAFFHLLSQLGACMNLASKEWVINHYKWIVWKLACYERFYPARAAGKFLTVSNVLEELKYRYERELNHGHRSTIKRILEGDALPSSMMILCISSIRSDRVLESGTSFETQTGREAVKVELTDGWYSINAILDVPLSKQLAAGRLFVGQKLRIWGAKICGNNGPVSPLEVPSTVSLLLNMNGTYRAHWAERLGFCKVAGPPLAFRCIKSNGGLIPKTLAGITRIYPVLYRERLNSGRSVVISEKMVNKMMELYYQRRSAVVDGIISEYQQERSSHIYDDSESEGAKIYKMLETAEEPEFLMADMTADQLSCFAAYKNKLNQNRESNIEKSIEKALEDAGLRQREVTPFMRLRVVGLTYRDQQVKPKEGMVTIWNPTEKQRQELVEGEAYIVAGLTPSSYSDLDILHLQTRGSTTKWLPLSSNARKQFKPFFSSPKSTPLSSLSDIPVSNEFDMVAYVVHVGQAFTSGQQMKQWVFVTDESVMYSLHSEELINSLLAICFCSPLIDDVSIPPINCNLVGSTVGFCNLIKRAKDDTNHIWVADATENSTYYLNFDSLQCSHLRKAAISIRSWANYSSKIIEKLKEKVLYVVGGECKA